VAGALNSSAGIVSTASHGISQSMVSLANNDEFARSRIDARKRAADAAREGVWSGLVEGGGSVLQGLTSGISGLVSLPLAQSKNSGISGLVTGFGLGVVNIGVSPILGVSDGLNSVAQTVITQLNTFPMGHRRRPPRSLQRVSVRADDMEITTAESCLAGNSTVLTSTLGFDSTTGTFEVSLIPTVVEPTANKSLARKVTLDNLIAESSPFPILVDIGLHSYVILAKKFIHVKRLLSLTEDMKLSAVDRHHHSHVHNVEYTATGASTPNNDVILRWKNVSHFAVHANQSTVRLFLIGVFNSTEEFYDPLSLGGTALPEQTVDICCQGHKQLLDLVNAMLTCSTLMKNPQSNPDFNSLTTILSPSRGLYVRPLLAPNGFAMSGSTDGESSVTGHTGTAASFAYPSNSLLYTNVSSYSSNGVEGRSAAGASPHQPQNPARSLYTLSARSIRIHEETVEEQQRPRTKISNLRTSQDPTNSGAASATSGNVIGISGAQSSTLDNSDRNDGAQEERNIFIQHVSASEYKFGTANAKPLAPTMCFFTQEALARTKPGTSSTATSAGKDMFCNVLQELSLVSLSTSEKTHPTTGVLLSVTTTVDVWARLDEIMWQLIKEWGQVYNSASRCSCLAVINESSSVVVWNKVEMKSGKGMKLLPGPGYMNDRNTLVPGGFVLFFIWGESRSRSNSRGRSLLMGDSGQAKIYIESISFSLSMSTKRLKVRLPHGTISSQGAKNPPTSPVPATRASISSASPTKRNNQQRVVEVDDADEEADSEVDDDYGTSSADSVEILESSVEPSSWCKFVIRVK
jgi:hypothetical protein